MLSPLNNKILIKPDTSDKETDTGIIILSSEKEKPMTGIVVNGNADIASGERVLFSRYGLDEYEDEGQTYYLVSPGALLAIIT